MAQQVEIDRTMEELIDYARNNAGLDGRPLIQNESIARDLATLRAEVAAVRSMTYAGISRNLRRDMPGPEGSMIKLYFSDVKQHLHRVGLDMVGPKGLEWKDEPDDWVQAYLGSFSISIGGGTSEIQRNIIGERVLGLPRDR